MNELENTSTTVFEEKRFSTRASCFSQKISTFDRSFSNCNGSIRYIGIRHYFFIKKVFLSYGFNMHENVPNLKMFAVFLLPI